MILEAAERGKDFISKLFALLVQDKRFENLEYAAINKDFQYQLMADYGIRIK